jgi:hypothetical protein
MSHSNLAHWHGTPKCPCGAKATIYVVGYEIHTQCNTGDPLYCEEREGVKPEDVQDADSHWAGEMPRACLDSDVKDFTLCEPCFVAAMRGGR